MDRRFAFAPLVLALTIGAAAYAQRDQAYASAAETRAAMARAVQDQQAAQNRAKAFELAASRADAAIDKTARETAALAARIQESEAGIAAAEARLALVDGQRRALAAQLGRRQKPVVRLTAALQRFSRRPLALSVMRPGSVKEMVYLRAMLATTVPEVQRRTAALRGEIERGKALQRQAQQALAALRAGEQQLEDRRKELAALETRQRLASRAASGEADREAERALALGEQARDLDALVATLDQAGSLRDRLAALPGPLIRPARPDQSTVAAQVEAAPGVRGAPAGYQLPVTGRTIVGFGVPTGSGGISQGLSFAPRAGAQVVAPGAGRVAFAGPYRGYGRIVIIEHEGSWTSLVTGMARIDVAVGDRVVGGAPLGIAAPARPLVTLELRRGGTPVNPLEFI
ncbi:MAG: peptidoglycan DD-metalloendopeptidase family protein [Candidatus Andeanibacterium colombiense]|uniref:Peptidoglycan DD-metalloendopeptidase family protein n=1 Tax=Candidatus Andeanibacterium colombiense TaxID=3121345 RepID=A0AAJ6BNN0_9SPHN|nr:MAG: peptidoglycan DD-metalloendopeptidase family protein [Sphingomonadaceae bacterium]